MVRSQTDESVKSSDDVKETRQGGKSEKVLMRKDQKHERGHKEKKHLDHNNKNQINKHMDQNVKAHQLMKKFS